MCKITHEAFIQAVRDIALGYAKRWRQARGGDPLTSEQLTRVETAKLVYGRGESGLRGITHYDHWKTCQDQHDAFVEICAMGEESWVQLAGTTIHEMAHVAVGTGVGHKAEWKKTALALGLRQAKAAGTVYLMANFEPEVRLAIAALGKPDDGNPKSPAGMAAFKLRPCSAGVGTAGGKSRGKGSGSRLRKYVCDVCGQIIRASTDTLSAMHIHPDVDGVAQVDGNFVLDGAKQAHGIEQQLLAAVFGGLPS